jgi:drug/metabolite transporter (DMT)-like permease
MVQRASFFASSTHRTGLFLAFVGVLAFSFTVPLTKIGVGGFDPVFMTTARGVIAGTLGIIALSAARVRFPGRKFVFPLLITVASNVFGWPILIGLALERTTSAHVAVIAAFMPLMTALIAVIKMKERVTKQFWIAAALGTIALVTFSLLNDGAKDGDFLADVYVVAAVIFSSWGYVEGASLTKAMPGWQVISWVVVIALPLTIPITAVLWFVGPSPLLATPIEWGALIIMGVSSMFLGFFAWYKGLAMVGIAYGSQVQQLQPLMTLAWSAWLLSEQISAFTIAAAIAVIGAVIWAQRSRLKPTLISPED